MSHEITAVLAYVATAALIIGVPVLGLYLTVKFVKWCWK